MPRRKKQDDPPVTHASGEMEQAPLLETDAKPFPERDTQPGIPARLSFKVTESGAIDVGSMREKSKAQFTDAIKSSLNDPDFRKQVGLDTSAVPQAAPFIDASTVGSLLDMLAFFESGFFAAKLKVKREDLQPLCRLDETEHAFFDGQIAKVADKYIPESWKARSDLYVVLGSLVLLQSRKFALCVEYAKLHRLAVMPSPKQPDASMSAEVQA